MLSPDFIKSLGFLPTELLGTGSYGEAWELSDGAVMKLTSSQAEEWCATRLFNLQLENEEKYSRFLPEMIGIGEITDEVKFLPETVEPTQWFGSDGPHFWYIREPLDDFTWPDEDDFIDYIYYLHASKEFADVVDAAILASERDIFDQTGLKIIDNKPGNWGVRTDPDGEQTIVLRDLACGDELHWWKGTRQQTPW